MRLPNFFTICALVTLFGACDHPTAPGWINPNPGHPIEVIGVNPSSGTIVTVGDIISAEFRAYTENYGVAAALVYLRDDGQSVVGTCGKAGKGLGIRFNHTISQGDRFWVPGHEIKVLALSKEFTSQAEYDQASRTCIFMGPPGLDGNQALFEKADHIEELAKYRVS